MRSIFKTMILLAIGPSLLAAVPANAAVTLTGTGTSTALTTSGAGGGSATIFFDGFGGVPNSVISGLMAKLVLTFNSLVGDTAIFGYDITNTSSDPISTSRIPLFGFDSNPDIFGAVSTGVYNDPTVNPNGTVPDGFGKVEFCARAVAGPNCAGGAGEGILQGDSTSGTLALTFATSPTTVQLSNFFVRYQSIDGAGTVTSAVGRPTAPLPEPAAWMMLVLGFGGIGLAMRKRNSTTQVRVRFA